MLEQAKALVQNQQKNRALLVLKLKKYKENELNEIDSQLISVFKMIEDIEWESANMKVLKALKVGKLYIIFLVCIKYIT